MVITTIVQARRFEFKQNTNIQAKTELEFNLNIRGSLLCVIHETQK